jgi:ankyrin repeat protein
LNEAARHGEIATVRQLVENGTDVNATSGDVFPLLVASCNGHTAVVEYLLLKGANPNVSNAEGTTALLCASYNGHQEVAKALLNAGARVNDVVTEYQITALMVSSRVGHTSLVKLLLDSGADPNQLDVRGTSALHRAVYLGNSDIVRMLVEAGANPSVRVPDTLIKAKDVVVGDTPLTIAKRKGLTAIAEYLQKQGATE